MQTQLEELGKNPRAMLGRSFKIMLITFVFTLVIPGAITYLDDLFFEIWPESIATNGFSRLNGKTWRSIEEKKQEYSDFLTTRKSIDAAIADMNSQLVGSDLPRIGQVLHVRESLLKQKSELRPPIQIEPFYIGHQFLLWPLAWTGTLMLICVLLPARAQEKARPQPTLWQMIAREFPTIENRRTLKITWICIELVYRTPTIFRNWFYPGAPNRTVFAYSHPDINLAASLWQEIIVGFFLFLVACLWMVAFEQAKVAQENRGIVALEWRDSKEREKIPQLFGGWVACSILLTIAFMWFTWFHWFAITQADDVRYIPAAFTVHLLWGISWWVISLPLYHTWRAWSDARERDYSRCIFKRYEGSTNSDQSARVNAPQDHTDVCFTYSPLKRTTIIISSIAAIVTFVLPLLQMFK